MSQADKEIVVDLEGHLHTVMLALARLAARHDESVNGVRSKNSAMYMIDKLAGWTHERAEENKTQVWHDYKEQSNQKY